jgi:hypothetical protein
MDKFTLPLGKMSPMVLFQKTPTGKNTIGLYIQY